jgi:hypothetical protein
MGRASKIEQQYGTSKHQIIKVNYIKKLKGMYILLFLGPLHYTYL